MPELSMRPVLILGGSGFIGSHLVDCCVASGRAVRVVSRRPERYRLPVPSVQYFSGEFSDRTVLQPALAGVETVIHLVSTTNPKTSNDDPLFDLQSNLLATVDCLQQCVAAKVRKVVFVSSGGVIYGNPSVCPVPETAPTEPLCSYGIVKLAIEKYLALFQSLHGMETVVVRAANPFGPRQNPSGGQGLIAALLARLAIGQPFEIWGDGQVVRDYLYVEDLAEAVCRVAFSSCPSQVYNVGSGKGHSILNVVAEIGAALQVEPQISFRPGRAFDVKRVWLDIAKIQAELGWAPQTSFATGIQRTWRFVRDLPPSC